MASSPSRSSSMGIRSWWASSKSGWRWAMVGVWALGGVPACGGAVANEESVGTASEALDVSHDATGLLVSVTAEGTGCPPGTWQAHISPDGETFTMTFSAFEVQLRPGVAQDRKKCHLRLDLQTRNEESLGVATFSYAGFVSLEKAGMGARHSTDYRFFGPAEPASEHDETLQGPRDEEFVYTDVVEPRRRRRGPCGRSAALKIRTELALSNDEAKSGTAYGNMASVDGTTELRVQLSRSKCAVTGPGRPRPHVPVGRGGPLVSAGASR